MRPFVGIGVLCLLLLGQGQQCFGQRVYADAEQHSNPQLLGVLSQVINPANSVNSNNFNDNTELYAILQLANIGAAWQNLQFTQTNKPSPNSPIYFKAKGSGGNVLGLLSGFSIQRTNSGTAVGQSYNASFLLGLLGLLGTSNDSTYLFVPPGATQQFDGVKLQQKGVLALGNSSYIYFSFFITTPKISGDTDSVCQNALPSTLTLTLANSGDTGITYYLFKDTLGLNYKPGSPLNTSNSNYLGTFTNHQITIPNPFLTLGTGEQTQKYYIIAQDNANSPAFFYSAWKEITFKRTILEPPPPPTADIQ